MEQRLAIVCSGQGGQHSEMADLFATDIRAWLAWENWQEAVLSFEVDGLGWRQIVEDPALLFANRYAQAMVVGYGLAAWAALAPQLPRPSLVAGYEVGELTAYGVSGSLAVADIRRLIIKRALLVDQAALLGSSVGSHPSTEAAGRWLIDLRATTWSAPQCPVLSGLNGVRVRQPAMAAQSLAEQLATPVCWENCMDTLAQAGIQRVLELGPGTALTQMMQTRHPQLESRALADFSTLEEAAQWAATQ